MEKYLKRHRIHICDANGNLRLKPHITRKGRNTKRSKKTPKHQRRRSSSVCQTRQTRSNTQRKTRTTAPGELLRRERKMVRRDIFSQSQQPAITIDHRILDNFNDPIKKELLRQKLLDDPPSSFRDIPRLIYTIQAKPTEHILHAYGVEI